QRLRAGGVRRSDAHTARRRAGRLPRAGDARRVRRSDGRLAPGLRLDAIGLDQRCLSSPTMSRRRRTIVIHLAIVAAMAALLVLCIAYPFLPGRYDQLAWPLS